MFRTAKLILFSRITKYFPKQIDDCSENRMTLASKATLPHTFIMVVMFSKLNAYVGSETCSCTIPAKDTCHVQYLLAYGCKECLPCSKKPLLGGRRHHACRRFFPPERKTSPSRGRIIFLPREILPTRDTGKTGSHIVSIFRPCADEPFSEEPGMIANRETPHGGISMHTMYDNMEKIGKNPCSVGGKTVTLHANSGFMRDI